MPTLVHREAEKELRFDREPNTGGFVNETFNRPEALDVSRLTEYRD